MNILKSILQTFCHSSARVRAEQAGCQKLSRTRAFTLIELLVVISIISFLSSIVLASMQTARDKAITTKITEDMRQVKIAAEMYYGDKGSYTFTFASNDINKDILANNNTPILQDFNPFSTKIANAVGEQPACDLFNVIAGNLVSAKYLSAVPVHPRQDYANGVCYKVATSSDGTYFAAYGETPATVLVGSSYVPKNIGFVAGNASISNLNTIRRGSGNTFLRTANIQTDLAGIADIPDAVIGITAGHSGSYGRSSSNLGYSLTITTTGNGTVTANPSKSSYNSGETVTLTASPSTGYTLSEWGGSCSGTGSCTVTMNGNKTVTATFVSSGPVLISYNPNSNYVWNANPKTQTFTPTGLVFTGSCSTGNELKAIMRYSPFGQGYIIDNLAPYSVSANGISTYRQQEIQPFLAISGINSAFLDVICVDIGGYRD